MIIIKQDITKVVSGVIAHQVNCQSKIGAGVSGAILAAHPCARQVYLDACRDSASHKRSLLGHYAGCKVAEGLWVFHVFGQLAYGNPNKTGQVYTDINALAHGLHSVCAIAEREGIGPVHVPFGIGCGLGGESWEHVLEAIEGLPLVVCKL